MDNRGGFKMPGGDRTGPAGLGPMTGRAAGFCSGYAVPGYANFSGRGMGMGMGRGRGRGFRNMYYATGLPAWARYNSYNTTAPVTAEQESEILKNQLKIMQDNMDAINKRISELEETK
jgi:hypothetical protein